MSLSDLPRKRAKIVVSGSSASGQAPSIPSANSATVTPKIVVYQRRRLRGNKKEQAAAATIKDPATDPEERVAILEKDFTAKADELEAKVKSVEEAADRHDQEQQEKIDILTAEKALITQDLKGELEAVSQELEQHKKILEKERARISRFEVEKKKIAVLADVTATYNLLLSFVAAFPELDYTLLGDDIVQKVEEIRLKLAKEEEKSAIEAGGAEG